MKTRRGQQAGETGFLSHSLTIGTIAGTRIKLHWTFLAYLVWLGAAFLASGGISAALSGVTLVIAVFACVVAHEFGHILMARRFGIASPDVTLLPIGGVARLQAIPERPGQELAVALAGPAVNLALAALLMLALDSGATPADLSAMIRPEDILPTLAAINLFLAVFNLLPAFPMDGGRALRAVLAIFLERARATRIAANIGQALAVGLGLLGLLGGNPLLIFIALFVYFAASAEAREAQLHRLAEGLRVADAMVTELLPLFASDTLGQAVQLLLRSEQREIPILDQNGGLVGILTREGLIHGLTKSGSEMSAGETMIASPPIVSVGSPLEEALVLMESNSQPVGAVDHNGRFAGLLTRESLGELLLLTTVRSRGRSKRQPAAV